MQEINYLSQDILSIAIPPLVIFSGVVLILFVMHKKKNEASPKIEAAFKDNTSIDLASPTKSIKDSEREQREIVKDKKTNLPRKYQLKNFFVNIFGESNPQKELMKEEKTLSPSPMLALSFTEKKWKMRKMKILDKEVGSAMPKEAEDEYERISSEGGSIDLLKKTEIVKDKSLEHSDLYEGNDTEASLIERIAVNTSDIEAYEQLGDLYIEHGSYTDAKECYKQVLRLQPINKKARTRMRYIEKMLNK